MRILNLSNHTLTQSQVEELTRDWEIVELEEEDKEQWGKLNPTNYEEICDRIANKYKVEGYHIAGFAPAVVYFVSKSTRVCLYAYSERKSSIEREVEGKVVKTAVFEHKGFYRYK